MQNNSKKIVMIGMPDMANICLTNIVNAGLNVVGMIPPHKNHSGFNNIVQCAGALKVPVYVYENTPNEPEFVEKIASLEADIGVISSLDTKLSREFLNTTREGYINCHPSLLPKYRGANPYFHTIRLGETKSGITLHFADENFDTGDIVLQKEISLEENETMGSLFNRTNYMIADSLVDVLKNYEGGGKIKSTKQKEGKYPVAPKVPPNIVISFQQDVVEVERLIRAANPFYNVILFFRGITFRIISAQIRQESHSYPLGQIIKIQDGIEIALGGGFLIPKIIQVGTWGIFNSSEFVTKFNPQGGERLIGG